MTPLRWIEGETLSLGQSSFRFEEQDSQSDSQRVIDYPNQLKSPKWYCYQCFLYYRRDAERFRRITRWFTYKIETYEYYRLLPVRTKMMQHKYVDKTELIKDYDPSKEEWKWVLQVKPKKIKRHGRFWTPFKKEDKKS